MKSEPVDCRMCGLAYLTDVRQLYTTPVLQAIEVCCGMPMGEGYHRHAGSYQGKAENAILEWCKGFKELPGPPRLYPPVTERMRKEGAWWTDLEPTPQSRLEDFA